MLDFSLCVLLYGDHFDLAYRCLNSLIQTGVWSKARDVRIGLNEVARKTDSYVRGQLAACPVPCWLYTPTHNVGKYPLMRRMFYSTPEMQAKYVMWFDDDSCISPFASLNDEWWRQLTLNAHANQLLGHVFQRSLQGNMWEAIKQQPWFSAAVGRPKRDRLWFATGGWWVGQFEHFAKWNWPWPELHHCGGDCLWGELMRHQGLPLGSFRDQLWINADKDGRPSKAARRGLNQPLLWKDYQPGKQPELSHQNFECRIERIDKEHQA